MHFAGLCYVGDSVNNPADYYQTNVLGSMNYSMRCALPIAVILYFRAPARLYGIPETLPITEDTPQQPINPYGETKLVVERILKDYANAYPLSYMALRYFNAAGADLDNDCGEAHDPETHLIPLTLDTATGSRPELSIFGDDYPTPDGTCVRDYIHITDLANAHVLAVKKLFAGSESQCLNLGTGQGYSIREVMDCVEAVTGNPVPNQIAGRRAGDPASLVANASLAKEKLGWTAEHSDLNNIIKTAWRWHPKA